MIKNPIHFCSKCSKIFSNRNNKHLKKTIFSLDKLDKNRYLFLIKFKDSSFLIELYFLSQLRPQLISEENDYSEMGNHKLMRNKERPIILMDDDEMMYQQITKPKKLNTSAKVTTIKPYYDLNDKFDKITLLNQIKQDYIRKHVLNSSNKTDVNTGQYPPTSLIYNSNMLFPLSTNRKKPAPMIEQSKLIDDADSNFLYFWSTRKKKDNKNNKKTTILSSANNRNAKDKNKIRTIKSIIKIDHGNNKSNLILNSEQQIIQPKSSLVLPPIMSRNFDLTQRFDKVTIEKSEETISSCDQSLNQCSINLMRKRHQLKTDAYNDRRMVLSITDEYSNKN